MLPRVNNAFKKFITPIKNAKSSLKNLKSKRTPNTPEPIQSGEQGDPQSSHSEPQSHLDPSHPKSEDPELQLSVSDAPKPTPINDSAPAILQLFSALKEQKVSLIKWFGTKSYGSTAKATQRKGKFKKGSMLDEKIE